MCQLEQHSLGVLLVSVFPGFTPKPLPQFLSLCFTDLYCPIFVEAVNPKGAVCSGVSETFPEVVWGTLHLLR